MSQFPKSGTKGRLSKPLDGIAIILSLAGMVFFAPFIWPPIEQPILLWLNNLYGRDAAILIGLVIMVATYPLTYYAIRLSITAAHISLQLFIVNRP